MTAPDPYQDLLSRLRSPDVGRVGAREMLREVLRRLPVAWDPRVLDAARDLMRRFPPLAAEFAMIEQMAAVNVTSVVERALGLEETVLSKIGAADRDHAAKLFHDLKAERGRSKEERARLFSALGRRLLEVHDRKNGRAALREALQLSSGALRAEIGAILDDLPGAKGREWRSAAGTVVVPGNPSDAIMVRVKGKDAPPKTFVDERLLGGPLLAPCNEPGDALSLEVTLEHDMERVRHGSVRAVEATTAPMVGLIARGGKNEPIAVVCGAFVSALERFTGSAGAVAADTTHVSIRFGASFAETRLDPVGPPKEGDGWHVVHGGRSYVRTRGGCWLRFTQKGDAPAAGARVRFQVTRTGMVWTAVNVKTLA